MARTVRAPDGRTWRVGRQWVRHGVRWRRPIRRWPKEIAGQDSVEWLELFFGETIIIAVAILAALLVIIVVFPALALAVDLLLVLVFTGGGVATRLLFRRPWTVVAEEVATSRPDPQLRTWQVVGWRASGRLVDEVSRDLEADRPLPI